MNGQAWLEEVRQQYRYRKEQCERAIAQVTDEQLFETVGEIPVCLAVQLKHIGNNHRSRWRDFLTTDGEKADRHRDREFLVDDETATSVREIWEEGWRITSQELDRLGPDDLESTVTIRGEPMTAAQAILRNLTHLAYHTGQIVSLARHFAGADWQTLSIAPGESEAHNRQMRERFGDWTEREEKR